MQATALSPHEHREIRAQVASFLAKSPGFARLAPRERAQVMADTERVVGAMAEARTARAKASAVGADPYANLPYATAQADLGRGNISNTTPDAQFGQIASGGASQLMQKQVSQTGSIIDVGVEEAAKMIREIDFPTFVSKLIEGTFHAIVRASIEQMKAYAEMVRSVSTSLDDFRDRNTTDNQARDHLVSSYPSLLQVQLVGGEPKVTTKDDADTDNLPDFQKDLGLSEPITDLDDETIEQKLVPAARDDLARGRQQLLATIILMGINRIVVTDGRINAKIKFNFSARETRQLNASAFDYAYVGQQLSSTRTAKDFSDGSGTDTTSTAPLDTSGLTADQKTQLLNRQMALQAQAQRNRYAIGYDDQSTVQPDVRVSSQADFQQEGSIQAAGQIMGEVQVNFKSDVFPLEKMVDTDQLQRLTQAQGAGRGAPPPPAPGATPSGAPTMKAPAPGSPAASPVTAAAPVAAPAT
jgi:hypothetical protein